MFLKVFENDFDKLPQNKEEYSLKCYQFYLEGRENQKREFKHDIVRLFDFDNKN